MSRKLQVFLPIAATVLAIWLASFVLGGCSPRPTSETEEGNRVEITKYIYRIEDGPNTCYVYAGTGISCLPTVQEESVIYVSPEASATPEPERPGK